jgi:hypothetical protein
MPRCLRQFRNRIEWTARDHELKMFAGPAGIFPCPVSVEKGRELEGGSRLVVMTHHTCGRVARPSRWDSRVPHSFASFANETESMQKWIAAVCRAQLWLTP